jgi:hypothetical protein
MTRGHKWKKKKRKRERERERKNKAEEKTHLNNRKTREWNTISFGIYDRASC